MAVNQIRVSTPRLNGSALQISVFDTDGKRELEFEMPGGYQINSDLIAIGLTTLFGTKYDVIEFDGAISESTRESVARLCQAEVTANLSTAELNERPGSNIALNFSGGFDSLAARTLLPASSKLLSIDFGGAFKRERDFFENFNPYIIKTNFRQLGFAKNTWAFMGVGSILLRDHLSISTYSFGSILEASPYNFIPGLNFSNDANPWFRAAGLTQLNPALGLTEVGTAMLLCRFHPELISESLVSLAAPGSEKLMRKKLLVRIAGELLGHNVRVSFASDDNEPLIAYGESFASDFLVLYICKRLGRATASTLVGNIPDSALALVDSCRLSFYERLNTNFYNNVEGISRLQIFSRCAEAGIDLYDERDWLEFDLVRKLLAEHHPIPGQ